ncbi:D-threo-aldose 1-dehydrogenase [Sphingomonas gellani]|uniref:D-threo-aldose 1-dehydrogenase n=1 Tax=Sphingomonas gellani TaxID=1166340 RepID=A0A1H8AXS0_9SPHN|nr:aldo/keto reductase [Sphingomonas gellani]SEM75571.1 D-threo-aldose 1-dehydrogenase [Sphingomonas gellani]
MIALPELGMGCAAIGNLYRAVDDQTSDATVAAAWDAGIRFFDVAPHYGFGLAEIRLGRVLGHRGLVSTKVGRLLERTDSTAAERHGFVNARPYQGRFDYSGDAVRRSHDESLARLGRSRVDVLLAHDLGERQHGPDNARHLRDFLDSGYRALADLRDQGAVDAIGIGVNEIAVCDTLLDAVQLDVILLAGRYTLLEQEAARPLLERCAAKGTRVVIGGPYNSGILIDGSRNAIASHFDYGAPPPSVIDRVRRLEAVCDRYGVSLPAAALRFPLRARAVVSVIPGLVGTDQVQATTRFAETPIPDAFWADAKRAVA